MGEGTKRKKEEEEEEGHLVWRVHKRLAVLSHKICWKGCVSPSLWLELVSSIGCRKCGERALAFKKDLGSSKQTNGQYQETGFWKRDGTLMTNSLGSLSFTAYVLIPIMKQYTLPQCPPSLLLWQIEIFLLPWASLHCLRVAQQWGWPQWPITQTTHQLLVGWYAARTILLSLPITELGTQRDTQLVSEELNKLGSCPKESEEGHLLAQCVHIQTEALVHPLPDVA